MKKLLILLFSFGLAFGASAQFHGGGGHRWGGHYYRPRVSVGIGFGYPFYAPYGYYGNPYYYGYGYPGRPSKLSLQIEDIENDYSARIWSVRHDTTIPRKERRKQVRQLKADRDREIIEAKRNYFKY